LSFYGGRASRVSDDSLAAYLDHERDRIRAWPIILLVLLLAGASFGFKLYGVVSGSGAVGTTPPIRQQKSGSVFRAAFLWRRVMA